MTKPCYYCKLDLPLDAFEVDNSKYTIPTQQGRRRACIKCAEPENMKKIILGKYPRNKEWWPEDDNK
jgi:hypothetical protein